MAKTQIANFEMSESVLSINLNHSGFDRIFQDLAEVVDQDSRDFTRDETARLAEECARQLSLRSTGQKARLKKDIRSVFAPLPKNAFREQHKIDGHGMKWLSSGPEYLIGVKPLRYHVEDTVDDMLHLFWKTKGRLPENRIKELGDRKTGRWNFKNRSARRQHVFELQRLVVRRATYRQFVTNLKARLGRLEASFAWTAEVLRSGSAKVSARIRRHFPSQTNITNTDRLLATDSPVIQFGSFAPGITNFTEYIDRAVLIRSEKMARRWKLIVSGYSRDVQNIMRVRRKSNSIGSLE